MNYGESALLYIGNHVFLHKKHILDVEQTQSFSAWSQVLWRSNNVTPLEEHTVIRLWKKKKPWLNGNGNQNLP